MQAEIKNRKKGKQLSVLMAVFVISCFVFLSESAGAYWTNDIRIIGGDLTWKKEDSPIQLEGPMEIRNGATLTIEPGVVIETKKKSNGDLADIIVSDGQILANGNDREKIIFKPANGDAAYTISFYGDGSGQESLLRFVEVDGGGYGKSDLLSSASYRKFIGGLDIPGSTPEKIPALYYNSGKLHIENSKFSGSKFFDVKAASYFGHDNEQDYFEIVNSNFGNNSENTAIISDVDCGLRSCSAKILLKNNWYGDMLGPKTSTSMLSDGLKISGDYKLDGWRSNDLIVDPVLIIPGITGSAQSMGEWKLDPITHAYDDLVASLMRNGYAKDKALFEFPYDWRKNNATTARSLQSKVEGIINETKISKVDVVAHSMGGLVARAYIEEIEGSIYNNTIDKLITLGTPQKGSPEAYLKWEAGEGFFTWKDKLARHHFEQEAEENGYNNVLHKYIQEKIPTVKELLPIYDYLYDINATSMREYFENYPRNTFLEDLNDESNVEKLKKVNFVKIVGKSNLENTISKIRIVNGGDDGKWVHGMPENYYNDNTDQGLEFGYGDETVPIESAKEIASDKTIEIDSSHGDLPTKAQCEVFKELTSKTECDYDEDWHMTNVLLFNVFSPIDIQIVAPDGKRVGKDFATGKIINEISGAYYSGFDTNTEFVTIPNPQDGEYQILTQGTDNGDYRIETVMINENDSGAAKESMKTITGVAELNKEEIHEIKLESNAIEGKSEENISQPITPPVVVQQPQEPISNPQQANKVGEAVKKKTNKKKSKKKHKKKNTKKKILYMPVAKTAKPFVYKKYKTVKSSNVKGVQIKKDQGKNSKKTSNSYWNNFCSNPKLNKYIYPTCRLLKK